MRLTRVRPDYVLGTIALFLSKVKTDAALYILLSFRINGLKAITMRAQKYVCYVDFLW